MILWFAGLGFLLVVAVFRDAALDYRLVMAGTLLPDVIDVFAGGVAHSLLFSVVLLTTVMLATRRRRAARRRLLALPIGTFVHLVLDGAWADAEHFWWPALGSPGTFEIPSLQRPLAMLILLEVVGALALRRCWQRFRLGEPANRARFLSQGRLDRDLIG